jgi:hypothetical protein
LRTDSICWDCANATVKSCSWIRQQKRVWDSAVTEVTSNGLRYKVIRCGNYVPDAVTSEEMQVVRRLLVVCV